MQGCYNTLRWSLKLFSHSVREDRRNGGRGMASYFVSSVTRRNHCQGPQAQGSFSVCSQLSRLVLPMDLGGRDMRRGQVGSVVHLSACRQ